MRNGEFAEFEVEFRVNIYSELMSGSSCGTITGADIFPRVYRVMTKEPRC